MLEVMNIMANADGLPLSIFFFFENTDVAFPVISLKTQRPSTILCYILALFDLVTPN